LQLVLQVIADVIELERQDTRARLLQDAQLPRHQSNQN
jgi:hypothetical protein